MLGIITILLDLLVYLLPVILVSVGAYKATEQLKLSSKNFAKEWTDANNGGKLILWVYSPITYISFWLKSR